VIVPVNGTGPVDIVEGLVTAVSPTTITVGERRGTISRHKPVDCPAVGTRVRLELDARQFIRALTVTDDRYAAPAESPAVLSSQSMRLGVLQAAAAFCAGRPDAKSADVLKIADAWLAWVDRSPAP
jgi:hypothetical protein